MGRTIYDLKSKLESVIFFHPSCPKITETFAGNLQFRAIKINVLAIHNRLKNIVAPVNTSDENKGKQGKKERKKAGKEDYNNNNNNIESKSTE